MLTKEFLLDIHDYHQKSDKTIFLKSNSKACKYPSLAVRWVTASCMKMNKYSLTDTEEGGRYIIIYVDNANKSHRVTPEMLLRWKLEDGN